MPSADVYAAALIAACRGTGEPLAELAVERTDMRAKHYVIHAIRAAFPDVGLTDAAVALSAPGKPGFFYRSSVRFVLGQFAGRKPAHWWDPDLFGVVCAAVEEAKRLEDNAAAPRPPIDDDPVETLEHVVPRAAPSELPFSASRATTGAVERRPPPDNAGPLRTRLDQFARGFQRTSDADPLTAKALDRRKSQDLLADAAANTARLQAQLPPEPSEE